MATTGIKFDSPVDFLLRPSQQIVVENLAADPSGGGLVAGRLWLHTGSGEYRFYDGTAIRVVGTAATYTNEEAQDAVGAILVDTATLDLTYNDGTPSITGTVLDSPTVAGATPAQLRDRATHTGTQTAATVSDLAAVVKAYRLDEFAAPNTALLLGGQKASNVADGTAATDAATFGQLSAILQGQTWKDPVRLMTQSNDTLSGLAARDGVTPEAGQRVLVPNQTDHGDDGIYAAAAGAWARTSDADTAAELNRATVMVQEGTASAGDIYTQTATIVTLGTTDQAWVKSGEGNTVYTADGTTITLTGNSFAITTAGVTGTQLAASVAGNGLTGGAGAPLAVVGDATITVSADSIAVAAATLARITALEAKYPAGAAPFTINSGQTTPYTWNHNLGTRDIGVDCRYNDGDFEDFGVIVERPPADTNNLIIRFGATTTRPVRVMPKVY